MIDDWSEINLFERPNLHPFQPEKNNNNNLTYNVLFLILIFCFKLTRPPINRVVFRSISSRYIGKREDCGPGDKVNSIYSLAVFNFTFSRLLELQNPKKDEFRDLYRRRLKIRLIFGIHRHKHVFTPVFEEEPPRWQPWKQRTRKSGNYYPWGKITHAF